MVTEIPNMGMNVPKLAQMGNKYVGIGCLSGRRLGQRNVGATVEKGGNKKGGNKVSKLHNQCCPGVSLKQPCT